MIGTKQEAVYSNTAANIFLRILWKQQKIQHSSIFNIWTYENVGYIAAHGTTVFDGLKISLDGCYFALLK